MDITTTITKLDNEYRARRLDCCIRRLRIEEPPHDVTAPMGPNRFQRIAPV
jgi:hypothetical protein